MMFLKLFNIGINKALVFLFAERKDLSLERQEEIIEIFKDNTDAFKEIYDFYFEMIFKYLVKRTYSSDIAYDLAADTFLSAFEAFSKYKHRGYSIKVWLYKIAINSLHNYRKSNRRRILTLEDVPEGLDNMAIDVKEELKNIDKALFGDEELSKLSDAVSALNPKYQKVLSLYYFSNMSQGEIAEVLNRSRVAIKSMMHRAMTQLRQLMAN